MTDALAFPIDGVAPILCKLPRHAHEFICQPISAEWLGGLVLIAFVIVAVLWASVHWRQP